MLEALLLTALNGVPSPLAESGRRVAPSVELLEFLGEFGDDEDGLFDGARAPAQGTDKAAAKSPGKARAPAAPPASATSPTSPPAVKEHP